MKPSGTSFFDDDDGGTKTGIEPIDAQSREKPITARRAAAMERTEKVYPQEEGTVFPRELLAFAIDAAREGYVQTANMGAAFNIMKRHVKERWTVEKGPSGYVFKEHVHPLEAYLRPSAQHEKAHRPAPPMPREKPAAPDSEAVVEARKRWDAAKTSGDAGAMTRAANDLLRTVEADRAARGDAVSASKDGARHATSDILAPEEQRASAAGAGIAAEAGAALGEAAKAAAAHVLTPPPSVDSADPAHTGLVGGKIADIVTAAGAGTSERAPSADGGDPSNAHEGLTRVASVIAHASPEQRDVLLREIGGPQGSDVLERLKLHIEAGGYRAPDIAPGSSENPQESAEVERNPTGGVVELVSAKDRGLRPRDTSEDGPKDFHPDDPNGGMDRVKRARHRGHRFKPTGQQRHWIDPDADWDPETVNEVIRESGGRPVTPELLLIFSNEAYPDNRSEPPGVRASRWRKPRPGQPGRSQGWELLTEEKGDSYYGMAVYDPDTNTLVIANRGVNFTSEADRDAAYAVINGRESPQIARAQRLLYNAWRRAVARARELGLPPPRLVVTGHSLGGAMAQIQMATAYSDQGTFGGVDVTGATFATLGAQKVVDNFLQNRWRHVARPALDQFMKQRMVNYYREGDGMVLDRLGRDPMPGRFGSDVEMAGIGMDGLDVEEDMFTDLLRISPDFMGSSEEWRRRANLNRQYFKNHSLRSFFHPDFTEPLDRVLERRRRSRR